MLNGGVLLGKLRMGGAGGCDEGDDGNARCQKEIKSAYLGGVLRWIMSYE
jgi:hypothetical protein